MSLPDAAHLVIVIGEKGVLCWGARREIVGIARDLFTREHAARTAWDIVGVKGVAMWISALDFTAYRGQCVVILRASRQSIKVSRRKTEKFSEI